MSEHEVWKPCAKHHKYMCSNLGNIANIKTGFLLKPQINRKGYYTVTLSDVYKHPIKYNLHRIIAETFIPNDNPNNNHVNHKDENKLNNRIDNLEWCNNKYNHNYGTIKERISSALSYGIVCQCTKNKTIINEYSSAKQAIKDKFYIRKILIRNINNRFYKGYYWYYKKELNSNL